jgi:signal transduction histidine kinase
LVVAAPSDTVRATLARALPGVVTDGLDLIRGRDTSFASFGETITVRIEPAPQGSKVSVWSASRPSIVADWGVNRRNVAAAIAEVERALESAALPVEVGPGPSADLGKIEQRLEGGLGLVQKIAVILSLLLISLTISAVLPRQPGFSGWFLRALALLPVVFLVSRKFVRLANSANVEFVVNLPADRAMSLVLSVMPEADARPSGLEARFGTVNHWLGTGAVTIRVEPVGETAARLNVVSRSPTPLTDWGWNARRVRQTLERIQAPLLTAVSLAATSQEAARVRHQDTEVRLARLQAQVEAHFLYNTLAHLGALIDRDAPAARRMLDELVEYLRDSARLLATNGTTLKDELGITRGYLTLMRHRLGARLKVELELEPTLESSSCLPGTMLTLAENAVKHGIEPSAAGGSITIRARRSGDDVVVSVEDTGIGFQTVGGTGTGLANLKERLFERYGARARLALERGRERGVIATVVYPAEVTG